MDKENYHVDSPVRHNNIKFAIGDTIALTPDEAAPLLGYKVISRFPAVAVKTSAAADSIGKTAMDLDKALKLPPAKTISPAQKAALRAELLAAAKAAKKKGAAKLDPKAKSAPDFGKKFEAAAKVTKKSEKEGSDNPERAGSEQGAARVEPEASTQNTDFRKSKDGPEG